MLKTVSNRQLRRTVVAQQAALDEGVAPAIRALASEIQRLEGRISQVSDIASDDLKHFTRKTFWQRLRWLVTGR